MENAFLFDLDGVLIDSEREYTRIWQGIDACFPTGVEGFAHRIKGTTLENILSTYFREEDREAVHSMLRQREAEMRYEYCLGAERLLDLLGEKGIKKAIVTSSKKEKMEHLRRQRPELWDRVELIVDADCVTRSKPNPQGYLIAAGRLGVDPRRCVVVEDSLQGIRAGRAAGSFVVGLTGTFCREPLEGEPDVLLDCLDDMDLENIINALRQ